MNTPANQQQSITEKKLLIVEGKDEETFFNTLLPLLPLLHHQPLKRKKVQIISSGGNIQFKKLFPAIVKAPGFDQVQSLAVIQDADTNKQNTFKRVCDTLFKNHIPHPKEPESFTSSGPLKVGIFIISDPDNRQQGQLEALCLSLTKSKPVVSCIDDFMNCIHKKASHKDSAYKTPKNKYKARLRAFLSAMEEDTPSLGVAAQKRYWNFNSPNLEPLIKFLSQI